MAQLSEAEIEEITNQPFDPSRAVVVYPSAEEVAAAKKTISARVPDETSRWIYDAALAAKISPSRLIADLLAEAIEARRATAGQPARLVVDIDAAHRALDALAHRQAEAA